MNLRANSLSSCSCSLMLSDLVDLSGVVSYFSFVDVDLLGQLDIYICDVLNFSFVRGDLSLVDHNLLVEFVDFNIKGLEVSLPFFVLGFVAA